MLSRIASNLYWMSRYQERAESLARMLDVSYTMSLLPMSKGGRKELAAPLYITGNTEVYKQHYEALSQEDLLDFFAVNETHQGSIYSCIKNARDNAHAVRGTISTEIWESINSTWLEIQDIKEAGIGGIGASTFCERIKERSNVYRGAVNSTLLRSNAFDFIKMGAALERADNTARILDAKYQVAKKQDQKQIAIDYYHWNALLFSLSAGEAYHQIYFDSIAAKNVAELLILNGYLPRSLRVCIEEVHAILEKVEGGPLNNKVKRNVSILSSKLRFGNIEEIIESGLHDYLTDFLQQIHEIADNLQQAYMETL